jgi:UDP-3-O-[3-hydroxymyristoyl] glucosamine N-acyltransferase
MKISAKNIADMINGHVLGNADTTVDGPCKIDDAQSGKIAFLANPKYAHYIKDTSASIVIVPKDFDGDYNPATTLIKVDDVYTALSQLMANFDSKLGMVKGVSPNALVDNTAIIGEDTSIDDMTIIRKGAKIGNHCKIFAHVFIGDNVKIGDNVTIYPGVKIYHNCVIGNHVVIHANTVVGSDGFGFAPDGEGNYQKIPQIGNVVVGDHVEIGANTVIDRATMGSTIIHSGAKLDNLIQIAHNVVIGSKTVIAAQTGIAGSTKIGESCMIGGQVGIVGHITIADHTSIQAQSGVASSVREPNSKLYGTPAISYQNYLKSYAHFRKLNVIANEIQNIKNSLKEFFHNTNKLK